MASQAVKQNNQLSALQFVVDGYVIPFAPNTLKWRIPGDWKIRAMSAGGGATQSVSGLNTEDLIGKIDVEIANTAANYEWVRALKAQYIATGLGSTIQLNDQLSGWSASYQNMKISKSTEAHSKADGNISLEFEGDYIA